MRYRRFGRTGWMLSEIGYGMWGMAGWTGSDDKESLQSLQRSIDLGCNFFDTAWPYGDGHSEKLLAETIRVNFGIPTDHWARVDFEGFARVVDELGGVEMTVACPVNLQYRPPTSTEQEEMVLEPGVYHMDGST